MRSRARAAVALFALALVAATVVALPGPSAVAADTVPFTPKFTANANGAILTIGNNLLTCPAGSSSGSVTCGAARAGGVADDNGFVMGLLDVDNDPSTFNSSSSTLALPAGATVLWAGLYWGARLQTGAGGTGEFASTNAANQISFRAPGDGAYRTIAASTAAHDQFGPNPQSNNAYQRFADVTAIVQAAGNGDYWGANVATATGQDRYAGWAMTVVYAAPGLPLRNLTVFDGFNVVGAGTPQNITVSGFRAPQAGTVDAQLTMVAYEGDLSQTGDFTKLNNTQLATAISPGSNFFDSVNDLNGVSVTTRNPADRNMLGFDIKNLGASGAIPNGATSAQFTFSSNGDVYYPGVVGLAINLYAPDFTASSKTVVDLNGNSPAHPGDTLQYTLSYANTGQDPAVGVVSRDPLPAGTTYVPGSLALVNPVTGATTTPLSDSPGDDVGEFNAGTRTVTVRLGGGAGATAGGRMACSGTGCTDDGTSRQAYTFQVTLDPAAGGTTVTNLASLGYQTGTTGIAATYTTNPAAVDVANEADVAITKVMTPDPAPVGSTVTSTIVVTNNGPNTATGVTVNDPIPAGVVGATVVSPTDACSISGGALGCALGDLANGQVVTITMTGQTAPGSTDTSLTNVAHVTTTAFDPTPTNNVANDSITLVQQADLSITKTASPPSAAPGGAVTWTITVHNNGPSDAANVQILDGLDTAGQATLDDATIAVTAGSGTSCVNSTGRAIRCAVQSLPAGATATVTVPGTLASALTAGATIDNTASVASDTSDPNDANDTAAATVTASQPQADVRVTKTGPTSVVAGQPVTWTITATNFGPSDAPDVTLADTVPAGVTSLSISTTRGTCSPPAGPDFSCAVGTLFSGGAGVAGGDVTITITGTVAPDAAGPLTNTATASSSATDPVPGNNAATAITAVMSQYDLAVTKTGNRTSLPGAAGRAVDYTITISNTGPSAARDVSVSDLLPLVLSLQSVTVDPTTAATAWSCDTSQAGTPQPTDPAHGLITCSLPGPIQPGATAQITVRTTNPQILFDPTDPTKKVVETVTISAPADTDPTDNTATWTLASVPYSDLSLLKTAPATVTAGGTGTYTLATTNTIPPSGEDALVALAPTLDDTLPPGVTFVSANLQGSAVPLACTTSGVPATGQTVSCQEPNDIAPGATEVVEFHVAFAPGLAAGSTLLNSATVVSQNTNPDQNLANNSSVASSTVVTDADVAVSGFVITPTDPTKTGPGSQRNATFTVTNNGPSTATDVTFRVTRSADALVDTSTLPPGCTFTSLELTCTVGDLAPGQSVAIAYVLTVAAHDVPGTYPDSVHVFSSTLDSNAANNDAATPLIIGPAVTDLAVTKAPLGTVPNPDEAANPHPSFVAGGPFTYQFTVGVPNTPGRADAQGVVVTDTMPAGFTPRDVGTAHGTCFITTPGGTVPVAGGNAIVCDLGTLDGYSGGTAVPPVTVTVNGVVDPQAIGLYTTGAFAEQVPNTVDVTTTTPLAVPGDRSATTAVDIIAVADLQLAKTPDQGTVNAGGSIGYTLTVINTGPSDADHTVITDSLPVGFTLDPAQSQCAPPLTTPAFDERQATPKVTPGAGQQIACRVGTIAAGQSAAIHIVATTDFSLAPGTATNVATVGSLGTDPDLTNNTATADVTVARLTDLGISSAASTTTPAAGQDITFTGFAVNNGPSSAVNTRGDTVFPAGFVPVSIDVPFNTCTWNPAAPANPDSVPWQNVSFTLHCVPQVPNAAWEPGGSATNVVVMHIPGDTPAGTYSGTSTITSDTPETVLDNNTTSLQLSVQHVSDTHITKTLVDPNPMQAGRPATWRLTVTNDGPSVADAVVVSDAVPVGMTFDSAQIEGGAPCPPPASDVSQLTLQCPVGQLGVGESVSALVTFNIGADVSGQQLCNTALVGSGSLDPNAADNESQACGQAVAPPAADVALSVTPGQQTVTPGSRVEFLATVTDNGPGGATSVVAHFDIPPGFTDYSGVAIQWPDGTSQPADCVVGSLTCTIGDLAPGAQVVFRIVGTVTGEAGSTVTIAGRTTHGEPDPVAANDVADASVVLAVPVPPSTGGSLPLTGADVMGLAVAALAATGGGVALLGVRRSRMRHATARGRSAGGGSV